MKSQCSNVICVQLHYCTQIFMLQRLPDSTLILCLLLKMNLQYHPPIPHILKPSIISYTERYPWGEKEAGEEKKSRTKTLAYSHVILQGFETLKTMLLLYHFPQSFLLHDVNVSHRFFGTYSVLSELYAKKETCSHKSAGLAKACCGFALNLIRQICWPNPTDWS